MEEGFVLDHAHGATLQASWVEGQPRKSFWTGLKLRGTVQIPVTTNRCHRCGYLESYATPAAAD
jgi:hypothetical protein